MPMGAGARSSFQLTSFSVETVPGLALAAIFQYFFFKERKIETKIKINL
jgi:hypothetical protein